MIEIVPYQKESLEQVLHYMIKLYDSDATSYPWTKDQFIETLALAAKKQPYIDLWVFKDNEEVVGYGLNSFMYSNEVGGMVVFIEEIMVDEKCQGRGIAQTYFAFLTDYYSEAKRFRLEVSKANKKAQALYERLGFNPISYLQLSKDL